MKTLRKHQIEALAEIAKVNEGIIHLPTGSGKTFIQASAVIDNLEEGRVFVVLSPRILLTNQLYSEVKSILLENGKDAQYLIVHSGRAEDRSDFAWTQELPFREVRSTTSSVTVRDEFARAQAEGVPLIIFGTYDSAARIANAGIPVYMVLCDEAHYLVTEEFSWIKYEGYADERLQFNSERKYYFTATLKETASADGLGMNNSTEFGEVIYSKTPLELIQAGEILRPRLHLVDVEVAGDEGAISGDTDAHSVVDAFIEHRSQCKTGAKMLVVTKGSDHLDELASSPVILNELDSRPNLTLFDISSQYGPRINGVVVSRGEFLTRLQALGDQDEAIILHVRILAEGIDIPGITGVMVMNQLSLSKFLQTLGRATRLYARDRAKLYDGTMKWDEVSRFVKPYAWVMVPTFGVIGEDLRANITEIIYALRDYGFNASEDVYTKQNRGAALPTSIESINEMDTNAARLRDEIIAITHQVEDKAAADKLAVDEFRRLEELRKLGPIELAKNMLKKSKD
jgi:hypothetical protein